MKQLYTQFNKPTNQKLLKFPKVVNPTNKKTLLKKLWDKCNKQSIVLPLSFSGYFYEY